MRTISLRRLKKALEYFVLFEGKCSIKTGIGEFLECPELRSGSNTY